LTDYRCPRCAKKGTLIMSQHVNRTSGRISWRIRMMHKNRKECLLRIIKPEDFKHSKKVRK